MTFRGGVLSILFLVSVASSASAQGMQMGTPEQRSACGPDVGRFCKKVKPDEGPFAYLACLKINRDKLRPACRAVLEGNGQ